MMEYRRGPALLSLGRNLAVKTRNLTIPAIFAQASVRAHCGAIALLAAPFDLVIRAATALFAIVFALGMDTPPSTARIAIAAVMPQASVSFTHGTLSALVLHFVVLAPVRLLFMPCWRN